MAIRYKGLSDGQTHERKGFQRPWVTIDENWIHSVLRWTAQRSSAPLSPFCLGSCQPALT